MNDGQIKHAGWVGDNEYGVVTVAGRGGESYCRKPCAQCPWRSDLPTGVFPAEAFRISANTAYDMSGHVFACHMAGRERPLTCAGFLLRGSVHSLTIRMALACGQIDLGKIDHSGFPLYDSYRAMAEANGVAPDDPALEQCR